MSLLNRFINNIQNENLFQKEDILLLAISGGVDSVVLCELCKQAGFHFEIAHCNFQLRGAESEHDETFVQSLGGRYEAKVFVKKFDTEKYAAENKLSIQVAARELRYKWFEELIASTDNRELTTENHSQTSYIVNRKSYIVTAHHANDNIETLLMNFFKGTGIKGLRGILPKQGKIIRPLLFAKKEEILSFAYEKNLSFVEDSSNSSDKYTRNYFRNQLIPSLQKVFPQAEENLLDNIERFKDIDMMYQQALHLHKKKLIEYKGNEVHIPVLKLLKTEPLKTIIYEIIKDYGFTAHQTEEVLHLLKSESGKYISSATHRIINNRKWIIIAAHNTREASLILINEKDKEIEFEMGKLKIEKYSNDKYRPSTDNYSASLDSNAITFPLLLRKWKQGDYFYPLGMRKKKKLSRFFIDQKMSLTEKEQAWVIESNKRIIWIVGKRIDDRFKITNRTNSIITIHFSEF
jgi:tRNA(Ile)-lysidine synthase